MSCLFVCSLSQCSLSFFSLFFSTAFHFQYQVFKRQKTISVSGLETKKITNLASVSSRSTSFFFYLNAFSFTLHNHRFFFFLFSPLLLCGFRVYVECFGVKFFFSVAFGVFLAHSRLRLPLDLSPLSSLTAPKLCQHPFTPYISSPSLCLP